MNVQSIISGKSALTLAFCISALLGSAQQLTPEELTGRFSPESHPDFTEVPAHIASRSGMYLRKEVMEAFLRMHAAADSAGIRLVVVSATRNFDHQKSIWERKWNLAKYRGRSEAEKARDILRYSSMPGTSRHHWGTDLDMNSLSPEYFRHGEGKVLYEWLVQHAGRFGFCQTYTDKSDGRTGYEEEPWHWSYHPLSSVYLRAYNELVTYDHLRGFSGSQTAGETGVIESYVNGVGCGSD
jgi:zinc D-Ala-D-Ala carboxypeptidase